MPSEDSSASIGIPQLILCVVFGIVVIRWVFSSPSQGAYTASPSGTITSRRPRNARPITTDMIEVVQAMFPQISAASIRYDLERNGGNVEATTEKILSEGSLPQPATPTTALVPPPPSSSLQRQPSPVTLSNTVENTGGATASTSSLSGSKSVYSDLITRYNLEPRLKDFQPTSIAAETNVIGKKNDKASLFLRGREKRDNMILEARKKLEAKLTEAG